MGNDITSLVIPQKPNQKGSIIYVTSCTHLNKTFIFRQTYICRHSKLQDMDPNQYSTQSSFWNCLFRGIRFKVTLGKDQMEIDQIKLFHKPKSFAKIPLNEILNIRINEQRGKLATISIRLTNNNPSVIFQLPRSEAMKLKNHVALLN